MTVTVEVRVELLISHYQSIVQAPANNAIKQR